MAISGDGQTVVAGADLADNETGAAFAFSDQSGTLTQIAKLVAKHSFGQGVSVEISADASTIVVTAPFSNDVGAAYVFTKSGATWTRTAQLVGANTAASDNFGLTVAVSRSGTTVAVGSPSSNGGDGSADVFTKSRGTSKEASQVLPPREPRTPKPASPSAFRLTAPS